MTARRAAATSSWETGATGEGERWTPVLKWTPATPVSFTERPLLSVVTEAPGLSRGRKWPSELRTWTLSEETPLKLGAAVWPFRWQPPYEEAVRRIAGLGFRAAELIAWDRDALASYYSPARVRALRALIADLGLELSEFVSTAAGMVSPEPAEREACLEHFRRFVEVAEALGTRTINTVAPMPHGVRVPPLKLLPTAQVWTAEIEPGLSNESRASTSARRAATRLLMSRASNCGPQ